MKKILLLLLAVFCIGLCAVGCDGAGNSGSQETEALQGLSLNAKGVLSWESVKDAQEYKVTIADTTKSVTENKFDLLGEVKEAGEYTVTVKAYVGSVEKKNGEFAFTAVKLGAPTKPVIETDSETHAVRFVWQGDENTRAYLQKVNDGKWITNGDGYFDVASTGDYVITVKAKGYASGKTLYLESAESEMSERFSYLQGPVLGVESINVIRWTSDTEFDSYNLWANGQKIKENVVCTDGVYNLIIGDDPAITKTGEYNLQIEGVKDGKSYFSNMLEEVGTSNINENELYSFDNRVANFPPIVDKTGVSISDEQYHGDSGYSLKLELTNGKQLNFVKYAYEGFGNDIDFTKIKKISYWVYIPKIEGYQEDTFPVDGLPSWRWEKEWTKVENGNKTPTYIMTFFSAETAVPFDTWTKVEIDNVEGAYDNVFILSLADLTEKLLNNYVMYIDDIRYEELYAENQVADADYVVEYNPAAAHRGEWMGNHYVEMDFGTDNADKTITVEMDVCGTADASVTGAETLGLFYNAEPNADPTDFDRIFIDASKISSTEAWNRIKVKVKTNAEGKAYFTGMFWNDKDLTLVAYKIFIKNVKVFDITQIGGTAMTEHGNNGNDADTYYQSITGLKTDLAVGTRVTVEMDVYVTGKFNEWSKIFCIDKVYPDNVPDNPLEITSLIVTNDEGWHHVTFTAYVRNFDKLKCSAPYAEADTSEYGNAVYLIAMNKSADSFNYKNVTIVESAKSMTPGGDNGNAGNPYYQSITGLKTDLAVGTVVTVGMDVRLTGTFDEWSNVFKVTGVWTTEGGESKNESINSAINMNEKGWQRITFEATVLNLSKLRLDGGYAIADTSGYGNAVYLIANNKSADSFDYKNVTIREGAKSMTSAGDNGKGDIFYQSMAGLKTDLAVGTVVTVEMDVCITGEFNEWSDVFWVTDVWTAEGGEINTKTSIKSVINMEEKGWQRITFQAIVQNFPTLRIGTDYPKHDTSEYGNAVYLVAMNKSADSFNYKNVTITAK